MQHQRIAVRQPPKRDHIRFMDWNHDTDQTLVNKASEMRLLVLKHSNKESMVFIDFQTLNKPAMESIEVRKCDWFDSRCDVELKTQYDIIASIACDDGCFLVMIRKDIPHPDPTVFVQHREE